MLEPWPRVEAGPGDWWGGPGSGGRWGAPCKLEGVRRWVGWAGGQGRRAQGGWWSWAEDPGPSMGEASPEVTERSGQRAGRGRAGQEEGLERPPWPVAHGTRPAFPLTLASSLRKFLQRVWAGLMGWEDRRKMAAGDRLTGKASGCLGARGCGGFPGKAIGPGGQGIWFGLAELCLGVGGPRLGEGRELLRLGDCPEAPLGGYSLTEVVSAPEGQRALAAHPCPRASLCRAACWRVTSQSPVAQPFPGRRCPCGLIPGGTAAQPTPRLTFQRRGTPLAAGVSGRAEVGGAWERVQEEASPRTSQQVPSSWLPGWTSALPLAGSRGCLEGRVAGGG